MHGNQQTPTRVPFSVEVTIITRQTSTQFTQGTRTNHLCINLNVRLLHLYFKMSFTRNLLQTQMFTLTPALKEKQLSKLRTDKRAFAHFWWSVPLFDAKN